MRAKLDFIAAHVSRHAIRLMCRVLSVSPSWFHAWRATTPKRAARQAARDALADRIRAILGQSKGATARRASMPNWRRRDCGSLGRRWPGSCGTTTFGRRAAGGARPAPPIAVAARNHRRLCLQTSGLGARIKCDYAFDDAFRGSDDVDRQEWIAGQEGADVFHGSKGEDHFNGGMRVSPGAYDLEPDGAVNEVSYRGFDGRVTVDLQSGEGSVRDMATGQSWDHSYAHIQGVVGSRHADTLIGDESDNRIEGERGHDQLTGGEGADAFVFNGMAYDNGYDAILDFKVGEDVLEMAHMKRVDGTAIDAFGDLDTNGDGHLNDADATMRTWMGDSLLMTGDGHVLLMNVTEMTAEDFVFA